MWLHLLPRGFSNYAHRRDMGWWAWVPGILPGPASLPFFGSLRLLGAALEFTDGTPVLAAPPLV